MNTKNELAILDFGSQYTHLIARRIRELGVKSHIYTNDISTTNLENAKGIILSGGPRSLVHDSRLAYDPKIFDLNIPILGLCYGHQLIANHFGGIVESGKAREYGIATMSIGDSSIFADIPTETNVWMSHGDHVEEMPAGFIKIAETSNGSISAMVNQIKKFYGFQFHPEVHHTTHGKQMLHNFIFDICNIEKNWTIDTQLREIQEEIKKIAGNKNVFLLISGGVDSTVCFALLEKTLGKERVYGLHVDHGFMRHNESKEVVNALLTIGLDDLRVYDASREYAEALHEIADPEEKRQIIGEKFIDIVEKVMKEQGFDENNWLLGQGTIYPDTIESGGTKNADKIKTHHNRVDRIHDMIEKGLIIEPIKELYKDEVREIGLKLGLPESLIGRRPFPGPGLAIRCLCSDISGGKVTKIDTEQFENLDIYKLPMKSVGVQGDERSYAHPALLVDQDLDISDIERLSPKITNSHRDINRVLTLLSGDKTKLFESKIQKAYLSEYRVDLLRNIDILIRNHTKNDPGYDNIWQMPIILVPFGHAHGESIVLRPVESKEAMTVSFGKISTETIEKIIGEEIIKNNIDFVFYDVTNKPPGTIEWE